MTPLYLAGPAVEPVGVPEMRAFLRLEHADEDALVGALLRAARLVVEATTRLVLIEQSWRIALARVPEDGVVRLPLAPILAVSEVRAFDAAGVASVVPAADWRLERRADPARIVLSGAALEAQDGIEIDLAAGFGTSAEAVPAPLVQAIRLLAAHWFENRGDGPPQTERASLPLDVAALIAPYRRLRMG
ncbi:head-tail connector protein [Salinarimonas sp. NSM]|uniref:head-tail connector protein n=1 Tax=Salinarimonas sp. NSM TaxID=3458003 RepID=UPI004037223D